MADLFTLGGMYGLVEIRGCPGLSFKNTSERAMYLLNPGISNMVLKIYEDAPDWLTDLSHGVSTTKAAQHEI